MVTTVTRTSCARRNHTVNILCVLDIEKNKNKHADVVMKVQEEKRNIFPSVERGDAAHQLTEKHICFFLSPWLSFYVMRSMTTQQTHNHRLLISWTCGYDTVYPLLFVRVVQVLRRRIENMCTCQRACYISNFEQNSACRVEG